MGGGKEESKENKDGRKLWKVADGVMGKEGEKEKRDRGRLTW